MKRFNDKLKTNESTVEEVAIYASGYNYVDNGVKDYVIYGNKYQVPLYNFLIAKSNKIDLSFVPNKWKRFKFTNRGENKSNNKERNIFKIWSYRL